MIRSRPAQAGRLVALAAACAPAADAPGATDDPETRPLAPIVDIEQRLEQYATVRLTADVSGSCDNGVVRQHRL